MERVVDQLSLSMWPQAPWPGEGALADVVVGFWNPSSGTLIYQIVHSELIERVG